MKYLIAKEADICSICLIRYQRGDKIMKTRCKHLFHSMCILDWNDIINTCPLCRRLITKPKTRKNYWRCCQRILIPRQVREL